MAPLHRRSAALRDNRPGRGGSVKGLSMAIPMILAIAGVAVTIGAARVLVVQGVPHLQVNDPALPEPTRTVTASSWVAALGTVLGLGAAAIGLSRLVTETAASATAAVIAAALLCGAAVFGVRSVIHLSRANPDRRFTILGGPSDIPARIWVTRSIAAALAIAAVLILESVIGFGWALLLALLLCVVPGLGVRYAHNRRAEPGQ